MGMGWGREVSQSEKGVGEGGERVRKKLRKKYSESDGKTRLRKLLYLIDLLMVARGGCGGFSRAKFAGA